MPEMQKSWHLLHLKISTFTVSNGVYFSKSITTENWLIIIPAVITWSNLNFDSSVVNCPCFFQVGFRENRSDFIHKSLHNILVYFTEMTISSTKMMKRNLKKKRTLKRKMSEYIHVFLSHYLYNYVLAGLVREYMYTHCMETDFFPICSWVI